MDEIYKGCPGDNRNISCRHHGEQALACTNMQPTTIVHCPRDRIGQFKKRLCKWL
ncbi:MAG: hypothetical protein JJE18_00860 [Eubacteriaceae bacterium]|nr:hypothetical protein [Eubacteriaceae bacterium]